MTRRLSPGPSKHLQAIFPGPVRASELGQLRHRQLPCNAANFHFLRWRSVRWFNKGEQKEVWEDIELPVSDDFEAARKIREICNSAAGSTDKSGRQTGADAAAQYAAGRYKRAAKVAMEIAIQISDELLRDAAVCQIVGLCVNANDLKTAGILFRAVQDASLRENLLRDHPALRPVAE